MDVYSNRSQKVPALLLAEQLPPEVAFALNVESEMSLASSELKMAWGLLEASFGWATEYQRQRDFAESMERFGALANRKNLIGYGYQAQAVLDSKPFWRARLEKTGYTPNMFAEVYKIRSDNLLAISIEIAALEEDGNGGYVASLIGRQYEDVLLALDAREAIHPSFPCSVREEAAVINKVWYSHDSCRILESLDASVKASTRKLPIQSKGTSRKNYVMAPEVCRVRATDVLGRTAVRMFGADTYEATIVKRRSNSRLHLSPAGRSRLLLMVSRALQLEANGEEVDAQEKTYLNTVQDIYTTKLRDFTSKQLGIRYTNDGQ